MSTDWHQTLADLAAPHLHEPVLHTGLFTRPGMTSSVFLQPLSPLLGTLRRLGGKQQASGLPTYALLALTDERLHVFDVRAKGRGWTVREHTHSFERAGLAVRRASSRGPADTIEIEDGTNRYQLETPKLMSRGFNDALIAAMVGPTAVH